MGIFWAGGVLHVPLGPISRWLGAPELHLQPEPSTGTEWLEVVAMLSWENELRARMRLLKGSGMDVEEEWH